MRLKKKKRRLNPNHCGTFDSLLLLNVQAYFMRNDSRNCLMRVRDCTTPTEENYLTSRNPKMTPFLSPECRGEALREAII